MSAKPNNPEKDMLTPFLLITWGLGALAIFLPAQFQALWRILSVGESK